MSRNKELKERQARGRNARHPFAIPWKGWWEIIRRVQKEITNDALQLMSAGIAFYFFLSVFPILAATISIYGLFVTPAGAEAQVEELGRLLPTQSQEVISEIAQNVASKSDRSLGWGLVITVLLSIWSANKGTRALVRGLNIAYGEKESRKYLAQTALTLVITLGAFLAGIVLLSLVAGVPAVLNYYEFSGSIKALLTWGRWPLLALLIVFIFACLYRWAPNRATPRWQWISPGSIFGMIFWLLGSAAFSYYVDQYDTMGKTYGSFAAVVSLLLWFFLTAFVVLLGAEINCESERQTRRDTTIGPPRARGQRGAASADEVAEGEEPDQEGNPLSGL
ncbi:YihY/virulence factor BrkB family protein [Roseibacillus persicicus]|uniref:Ribonuclease n=1 Tax=Roseibacillus persicicus TaxID=454148 RepID=A0A918TTN4_9BACT|nr:YihY/virulence factor BrkB family protein [Roseibacillus persicicus]GHC60704.1 ribonuclease [Roseibacillus persicicus]